MCQNTEHTFLFVLVAKSSTVVKHFALGMTMVKSDTSSGVFVQPAQSFCKISFTEASAQKKLLISAVRNIPSNSSTSNKHISCDR